MYKNILLKIQVSILSLFLVGCSKLDWAYEDCSLDGTCKISAQFSGYDDCQRYIRTQNWMVCDDKLIQNSRYGEAVCFKTVSGVPDGRCVKN